MPFKEPFHHLLPNHSEIVFDTSEGRYSLPPAEFRQSSISASQEIQDERLPLNRSDEDPNICLNSYHRLVSHLGKLALEGTQLSDLYQNASQLLVQELNLVSCEFWEILTDQDTLNLIDYTTSTDISVCPQFGFEPRSLKQILQDSQVCHEVMLPSKGQQTQLLSLAPQRYGLIIPGKSYPAGLMVLSCPFQRFIAPAEVDLLQDVASILASAVERKRAEMLLLTQTNVLQAIASGSDLQRTLFFLCQLLEQQNPGAYCSVLFLDAEKRKLQSGLAPSLPKAYAAALNGLMIGDCAGSCGTAAFRGEPIFVHDIATDPLWAEFRSLALSHGIRSCWSMPFCSQAGNVLGTFALSFEIPCQPTTGHLKIMETATHLASIATERFQSTQKLTRLALYDDLTDLVNRSFFTDYLASQLEYKHDFEEASSKAKKKSFALLFLDLDRFKLVNDSLGHIVGDQLLIAFAKRVLPYLKPEDIFARLGGDEFAIFLASPPDKGHIEDIATQLLDSLNNPIQIEANDVFVTASIGIVHAEGQYQSPQELLRDADTAMYEAKTKYQGGGYVFFDEYMHTAARNRLQLEVELRRDIEALLQGTRPSFFLTYQPIVALQTGELAGFEVLLRWAHSQKGNVFPDDFIAILEETGLILPLGDWVLETACKQLLEWRFTYPQAQDLTISINVSGKQFLQPNWASKIEAQLNQSQLPPSALRLEVTESVLVASVTTVSDCFDTLKSLGIPISLDDFGTGYSSLSYLQDFPVDHLKIDRSFIAELEQGENSIVQAVINLSHNLGMKAVAEGVENVEQLRQLLDLGCDFCQGYLLAKPLLSQAATAMIASQQKFDHAGFGHRDIAASKGVADQIMSHLENADTTLM